MTLTAAASSSRAVVVSQSQSSSALMSWSFSKRSALQRRSAVSINLASTSSQGTCFSGDQLGRDSARGIRPTAQARSPEPADAYRQRPNVDLNEQKPTEHDHDAEAPATGDGLDAPPIVGQGAVGKAVLFRVVMSRIRRAADGYEGYSRGL